MPIWSSVLATAASARWPVRAFGSPWDDAGAGAVVGVAAALAWLYVSRRRGAVVMRWQRMHVGDRLPHLRLGERFQALQLRSALFSALRLGPGAAGAASPEHLRRVLVVDDDADLRALIGEALSSQGFAVCEAADGVEALGRARDERPDLILLDLMMPRMDGFAFRSVQRTDAQLAHIPVVVISGTDAAVGELDAAAYLHKPFELGALLDAVRLQALAPTPA